MKSTQDIKIDDNAIKNIVDAYEKLKNAILETYREVIDNISLGLQNVIDAIKKEIESIEIKKPRAKWPTPKPHTAKPLYLDKRSKVHRCRNAI